jgi:hypothetical protein
LNIAGKWATTLFVSLYVIILPGWRLQALSWKPTCL